jgi:N-methylhydantoinase A
MIGIARLAIDIGGTFTDLALDHGAQIISTKILTTPQAPEHSVLAGIKAILSKAHIGPHDIGAIVHGTTLATNAIIERKGARTALLVSEGFRDSIEMAYENRFEQYDIFMDKPPPLVPRELRFSVPERIDARGNVICKLDEDTLAPLAQTLEDAGVESLAIGFLHSYAWPEHERRARDLLKRLKPELWITCSADVSPEIREYERWSTACANAYVQPIIAGYLGRLDRALLELGFSCPVHMMTSAGGLTSLATARTLPIRLVESGPAGGAILASRLAKQCGLDHVLSFDMGGTTAKICLIDDCEPQYSRTFEVARQYRFLKGSGLPLRIPAVVMVEIGAGGGSIAKLDSMQRIQVGPESAGSEPGPACYNRGGVAPTVTDADVVLGAINPSRFAGGMFALDASRSADAIRHELGDRLGFTTEEAAYGIAEVVEENMANAARVHAVEHGKELAGRTMIAFGGAAPLHAARLAEKLGIDRVLIPTSAGVGSAVGFLLAPVSYETVRTSYAPLDSRFDVLALQSLRNEMRAEAEKLVEQWAPHETLIESWTADMRYVGQGHELTIAIPPDVFGPDAVALLERLFTQEYRLVFGITIPDHAVEVMSWSLRLTAPLPSMPALPPLPANVVAQPAERRELYDLRSGKRESASLFWRNDLEPGTLIEGPAIIAEDETSTLVGAAFTAQVNALGYIALQRKTEDGS